LTGSSRIPTATCPEPPWCFAASARRRIGRTSSPLLIEEGASAEAGEDTGPTPEVAAILAIEGDVAYGQYLSSECTVLPYRRGRRGHSVDPGPDADVFIAGMAAYRSGERQHQVMNTLAGRLGDEEIAALAAYFLSENN
jgi:cytochrome c